MLTFLVRRIIASALLLLVASFFVYILLTYAGDPLGFLNEITDPKIREDIRLSVIDRMSLDTPRVIRYFHWLGDVVRGDFGISTRTQLSVNDELASRLPLTLKLVFGASILSTVLGVTTGIVTALRQYSGFDYIVTFFTFLFFSLPVFWVAVILKKWGGLDFNDWWRDGAKMPTWLIVTAGIFAAVIAYSIAGGRWPRRSAIAAAGGLAGAGLFLYLSEAGWFVNPGIGLAVLIPLGLALAVAATAVFAGIKNQRALGASLTTAVIGMIVYLPIQPYLDGPRFGWWHALLLLVITLAVSVGVGFAWGGYDRGLSAKVAALVGFLISFLIFVDRHLQSWNAYATDSITRNRPIKTVGHSEPRFSGKGFWIINNDAFAHMILPTLALMLISLAGYTRYTRASMLEVLNLDYIRTARAKGLTERTVVVRHGLRNALIPLATIVAFDIGGMLGGAVITETVFEWAGMGRMFIDGLGNLDPNVVMAATMVVGATAVVANILADVAYSVLDPRIRLNA
ncbi:MAG TPA: ABC transporter permease [Ilumatobacter sp.]|nr:ABC transporter permease [Ilumatobacter sp.]